MKRPRPSAGPASRRLTRRHALWPLLVPAVVGAGVAINGVRAEGGVGLEAGSRAGWPGGVGASRPATGHLAPDGSAAGDEGQIRALWVDAFHDGIKTPAQVERLIADAHSAGVNTLVVQVRRRGDSYYNRTAEPRTEDTALRPGFDALQATIERARATQPAPGGARLDRHRGALESQGAPPGRLRARLQPPRPGGVGRRELDLP